jgi:hypothetical protein
MIPQGCTLGFTPTPASRVEIRKPTPTLKKCAQSMAMKNKSQIFPRAGLKKKPAKVEVSEAEFREKL